MADLTEPVPKMYRLFEGEGAINSRELKFENDMRRL